jgi:hypothetical protein
MVNAWLYNNAKNAEQRARNEAVRISRIKAAEARAKLKAKRAQEAAKKAENQERQAAVERSKAEAAAERAARAAARGETSNRRNKTNAANNAAKKAAENAKKAQANAEKAATNAKKAQANALIQNVKKNWSNVAASTMSRNDKKRKVLRFIERHPLNFTQINQLVTQRVLNFWVLYLRNLQCMSIKTNRAIIGVALVLTKQLVHLLPIDDLFLDE